MPPYYKQDNLTSVIWWALKPLLINRVLPAVLVEFPTHLRPGLFPATQRRNHKFGNHSQYPDLHLAPKLSVKLLIAFYFGHRCVVPGKSSEGVSIIKPGSWERRWPSGDVSPKTVTSLETS